MVTLLDIITSKVRVKILDLFFSDVKEMYHVRGIVREIKEEINAVRRELERMENAALLKKEARGNRVYYYLNTDYHFYGDLLSIVCKTTGLGNDIIQNKNKIGRLSIVMFSGKFARKKDRKREDSVDILVVGEAALPELTAIIKKEESKRGKEINYTVMSREELEFRKKRRDPFLQEILAGSRVMIIGDEEALVS
ncbi:MAG: Transcriptional regulator [Candidatus Woesebacteria bacterium GW2011_GWC1_38_13]|uniref:Transcriptional regulator n=1 Tax=Candidatus Woesebacteria bacterium GW2011_GWC1_38_13 TaxID=1618583 RepID=A0A0G0L287_9BACT|nr:MAG: Transcriptional regulator [Candidatus Woesebacteria bacterium GW2011_GWC1_38_13]